MKTTRLHGLRKQKRDEAIRRFEFEHPDQTEQQIADAFGCSPSTVSRALKEVKEELE